MKIHDTVLLAMGLMLSITAAAADLTVPSNCSDPQWVAPSPEMVNDQFVGTMTSTCKIKGEAGNGIALLDAYIKKASVQSNKVNSGPETAVKEGMPAELYNVTFSNEKATVTSDEYIASNQTDKIVFVSTSTHTSGTNWAAALLRKLNVRVEVSTTAEPDTYEVTLTTLTVIQRFWACPADFIFLKYAIDPAKQQFVNQLAALVPEYTDALNGR